MVQITAIQRPFPLQLLPLNASSGQVINFEFVEYTHGQQTLYQQNLMSLRAETQLPEICDEKDVTIAVLDMVNVSIVPCDRTCCTFRFG